MTAAQNSRLRIGFIGAGKMATALACGWKSAGLVAAGDIIATDVSAEAGQHFTATSGGNLAGSSREVAAASDLIVLAVKPQQMSAALQELKPHLAPRHVLVSVAAGVSLATISAAVGSETRLVRVMPNTPCLVSASASAFALGGKATAEDGRLIERLLRSVGVAFELPEYQLDAVTGLSGSGPAFVFLMIEALADGGVKVGLPRNVALQLAAQTVFGAAKMVLETGEHPAALKDAVASPGGTTIAGLYALEQAGVRGGLMSAVEAATLRSRELGKN